MARMLEAMTIGELAKACGVSADTVRFYEREKLLPRPRRSASGYRLFGAEDAARVRFVRRAQAMGLTLDDIGELLRVEPLETVEQCRRVAARLGARVAAVEERIAELEAFRKALLSGLRQCERALARDECCPVVIDLAADGKQPR